MFSPIYPFKTDDVSLKPFQCPMPNCGMRFSVRSNLIAHGKRLHGRVLAPIVWSARHSNPPAPTTPLTPPPDAPKSGDVESSSDSKPAISAPVTTKTVPVLPPTLSTRDVLPPFLANLVHPTSPHPIPSTMMGDYPVSPPSTAASETDDSCSDDSVQKVDGNPVAVEDAVVEAVEPPRVEVRRISRREMALRKRNRLEHQVAAMTEGGNRLRDFSDNLVDMLHDAEQLDSGRGTNVTLSTAMRRLRKDMSALQQTLKLETANALLQLSVLPQHRLYPRLHFSPSFYNAHVM